MSWYYAYLAALFVLLVFATPRDNGALWVVFVAGVGSKLMTLSLHSIVAPWKLVFPASVEVLTILALLTWTRNRTGFWQVGLLSIAWATHLLCYLDLVTGSNVVYDRYSAILGAVAVGQLLGFYDTVRSIGANLWGALANWRRAGHIRHASGHAAVLHPEGGQGL